MALLVFSILEIEPFWMMIIFRSLLVILERWDAVWVGREVQEGGDVYRLRW